MSDLRQRSRLQATLANFVFDPPKLREKLDCAEQLISERLKELASDVELPSRQELVALAKALTIVRILEKNRMLLP